MLNINYYTLMLNVTPRAVKKSSDNGVKVYILQSNFHLIHT